MAHSALVLVSLFAACTLTAALVQLPPYARGGLAHQRLQARQVNLFTKQNVTYNTLQQRVDHFAPGNTATFTQRYLQNDMFWSKPNGPVFLYINGEDDLSGLPSGYLNNVAQENNALIVAVEHRYYGQSNPTDRSVQNLPLLTTEQSLADLAYFIDYYQSNVLSPLGSQQNKWFVVGGSYAGALSAWFRLKYPNKVVGAWSSSGVVNAILNFTAFDEQVAASAGQQCADAIRATTAALETDLANGKPVKDLFGAGNLIDRDFFYMTADSAAMSVQYDHKAMLCNTLVPAWQQGQSLSEVFANFTNTLWGSSFGGQCFYDTQCLQGLADQSMARSWRWQKCYELAYLQIAPDQGSLRSHLVNYTSQMAQCHEIFGDDIYPNTYFTNLYYGGANINGTNIVFLDASDDPWQQASVRQQVNSQEPFFYIQCDGCGHCIDLHAPQESDPPSLVSARQQISFYVKQWLNA